MLVRPPIARLLARWATALLIALAALPAVAQMPDIDRATRFMNELAWGVGHVGGPFELIDQNGKTRTDAEFRGELLLIYFGYTTCPDIRPAELMQIGLAIDKLGGAGDGVQPLFISIDPERDTPDVLARYVARFHPRLIGLTGTPKQIRGVADNYKDYYAKYLPPHGTSYLIDHPGCVYLMGRSGEYLYLFSPETSADSMIAIIRPFLVQH
ncbi:MAG: SCO family protein [Xanthobacteraceae bacterium]